MTDLISMFSADPFLSAVYAVTALVLVGVTLWSYGRLKAMQKKADQLPGDQDG